MSGRIIKVLLLLVSFFFESLKSFPFSMSFKCEEMCQRFISGFWYDLNIKETDWNEIPQAKAKVGQTVAVQMNGVAQEEKEEGKSPFRHFTFCCSIKLDAVGYTTENIDIWTINGGESYLGKALGKEVITPKQEKIKCIEFRERNQTKTVSLIIPPMIGIETFLIKNTPSSNDVEAEISQYYSFHKGNYDEFIYCLTLPNTAKLFMLDTTTSSKTTAQKTTEYELPKNRFFVSSQQTDFYEEFSCRIDTKIQGEYEPLSLGFTVSVLYCDYRGSDSCEYRKDFSETKPYYENCKDGYFFVEAEHNYCANEDIKPENMYLNKDKEPYLYKACESPCYSCLGKPYKFLNNCTKCDSEHKEIENIPGNCVKESELVDFTLENDKYKGTSGNYIYIEGDKYHSFEKCNDAYPYVFEDTNLCLNSCEEYGFFKHNEKCLWSCPETTTVEGYTCKDPEPEPKPDPKPDPEPDKPDPKPDPDPEPEPEPEPDEDLNKFVEGLGDLIKEKKDIEVKNNKYSFYTTKKTEPKKDKVNIDLGECEGILRKHYGIDSSEELVIGVFESEKDGIVSNEVNYLVYDSKGNQLDLKLCKETTITVVSPVNRNYIANISLAKNLSDTGVDIFNESDPFFTEYCYTNKFGKYDIILKDRRNDYYQDVSLCDNGCELVAIDYNTSQVECNCSVKSKITFSKSYKKLSLVGTKLFYLTNFELAKCYFLLKNGDNYKGNYGFYLFGIFVLLKIIMCCEFWIVGKQKLYHSCHILKNSPPFKKQPTQIINSKYNSELSSELEERERPTSMEPFEVKEKRDHLKVYKQTFGYARKNLESNPLLIFWTIIKSKLLLVSISCYPNEHTPFSVLFSIYLFGLMNIFFFNAVFFSEEVISSRYHNNGKVKLYMMFLVALLSNVVSAIIMKIVRKLTYFSDSLKMIKAEYSNSKDYYKILKKVFLRIRTRLILYFIFQFIFSFFYLYFIIIFSTVYSNSQIYWLYNSLFSLALSAALVIIVTLVISLMRGLSLKCKWKCGFFTSLFLDNVI